jgi:hypothetical protein
MEKLRPYMAVELCCLMEERGYMAAKPGYMAEDHDYMQ